MLSKVIEVGDPLVLKNSTNSSGIEIFSKALKSPCMWLKEDVRSYYIVRSALVFLSTLVSRLSISSLLLLTLTYCGPSNVN